MAEHTTSTAGVVLLIWSGDSFRTEQQFDDGNVAVIELPKPFDAFLCYEYAREHGRIRAPFPVPVVEPASPRRIRRAAGVTQKSLAAEIGVSEHQVAVWEQAGASLSSMRRGGRSAENCAKFRRYVEALATMEGYEPLKRPRAVAASPDGKRRCSHPGCGAILSRFNDGDRCACHE